MVRSDMPGESKSPEGAAWDDRTQALRSGRGGKRRGWLATPKPLVERARQRDGQAVASLCRQYRAPVRNFLQQRGLRHDQAEDVTQGVFERIVRNEDFTRLDPTRSFGAWLRASAMHHLCNVWHAENAGKRRLDEAKAAELCAQAEARSSASPDRDLDRQRALRLVNAAWARLRREYERAGCSVLFEHLKASLSGEETGLSDAALCAELGRCESYVAGARLRLRTQEFPAAALAVLKESPCGTPAKEQLQALLDALT